MQRKEIDRDEYDAIRDELTDRVDTHTMVLVINGLHKDHGRVILIEYAGHFFVDADDVTLVRALRIASGHKARSSVPDLARTGR